MGGSVCLASYFKFESSGIVPEFEHTLTTAMTYSSPYSCMSIHDIRNRTLNLVYPVAWLWGHHFIGQQTKPSELGKLMSTIYILAKLTSETKTNLIIQGYHKQNREANKRNSKRDHPLARRVCHHCFSLSTTISRSRSFSARICLSGPERRTGLRPRSGKRSRTKYLNASSRSSNTK